MLNPGMSEGEPAATLLSLDSSWVAMWAWARPALRGLCFWLLERRPFPSSTKVWGEDLWS